MIPRITPTAYKILLALHMTNGKPVMTTLESLRIDLGYSFTISLHSTLRSLWERKLIERYDAGLYGITPHGQRTRARIERGELPLDTGA